ncbi:MAG: hypothetical protein RSB67_00435 [Clostridia bacterium]
MNIQLIYNKNNKEIKERLEILKKYIKEECNEYCIKFFERQNEKNVIDIYLIISNDFEEIKQYEEKIKEKKKIAILTNNLDTIHILNCINISKTISYLESQPKNIVEKIILKYYKEKKQ